MTTKRTSLFSFFLKTVMVVLGLALTAVLVLNGWSWWELKQARESFEKVAGDQETKIITLWATQNLIAASKVGEGIEWTKDERIAVGTASSLACQDWTEEQHETVRLVVERNIGLDAAVLNALREPRPSPEVSEVDHMIILPMINLARLLTADARLALVNADHDHFIKVLEALGSVVHELEANPNSINHILNTAIRNLSNLTLLHGLSRGNPGCLDATLLNRVQTALPGTQVTEALRAAFIADLSSHLKIFRETCRSATPDSGMLKALIHPILIPVFCRFSEAAMIEQQMMLIDLIDRPFGLQPEAFKQPPRPPLWKVHRLLASVAIPNIMSTIGRTQAIASQRQLLDAALTMRTTQWPDGAYPETRPDLPALIESDPFSGQQLEYQLLADGQLHLGIADGPALLKAIKRSGPQNWLDPVVLDAPSTQ